MRIYTKIVFDIQTLDIVESDSYNHHGPICECKGGGNTSTTTVDPTYNAGMLALSELSSEKAVEYDNLFKYGVLYNPTETQEGMYVDGKWVQKEALTPEQIGGDKFVLNPDYQEGRWEKSNPLRNEKVWKPGSGPEVTKYILNPEYNLEERTYGDINGYDPSAQVSELDLMRDQLASASRLMPLQENLQEEQIRADIGLLPLQKEAEAASLAASLRLTPLKAQAEEAYLGLTPDRVQAEKAALGLQQTKIADTESAIKERAPLRSAFFKQAAEGIDVGRRMDQAQAEVQHTHDIGARDLRRNLAVAKVNPGDPAYANILRRNDLEKTKNIAAARSTARNSSEEEQFKRLALASSYGV